MLTKLDHEWALKQSNQAPPLTNIVRATIISEICGKKSAARQPIKLRFLGKAVQIKLPGPIMA